MSKEQNRNPLPKVVTSQLKRYIKRAEEEGEPDVAAACELALAKLEEADARAELEAAQRKVDELKARLGVGEVQQ